jgi:hypothetical protein
VRVPAAATKYEGRFEFDLGNPIFAAHAADLEIPMADGSKASVALAGVIDVGMR